MRKKHSVFIISLFLLGVFIFSGSLLDAVMAQNSSSSEDVNQQEPMTEEAMKKMMDGQLADQEKVRESMVRQQGQILANLKETDPEEYARQKIIFERSEQIVSILKRFHNKEIDDARAQKELSPLVQQEVEEQMRTIDQQISNAEKYLSELNEIKSNPNLLVQKRIERMLGQTKIEPGSIPFMPIMLY